MEGVDADEQREMAEGKSIFASTWYPMCTRDAEDRKGSRIGNVIAGKAV